MKKHTRDKIMILAIGFMTLNGLMSCEHDEGMTQKPLNDGYYSGSFTYDTLVLWESISINNGNYNELASGGVLYQKFPVYCLTKGSCRIIDNKIFFENIQVAQPPNGDITDYNENYLLMGSYNVENCSDTSLTFWRTINEKKQTYDLKLYYEPN